MNWYSIIVSCNKNLAMPLFVTNDYKNHITEIDNWLKKVDSHKSKKEDNIKQNKIYG